MRQRGTIRGWKDDKGFGFVTPADGGEEAFVHINAFLNRQRRPVDGDEISYEAAQDFQKRWQAKAIRFADEPVALAPATVADTALPRSRSSSSRSALPLLRGLLVLLILAILGVVGHQFWPRPAQASGHPQGLLDAPASAPATAPPTQPTPSAPSAVRASAPAAAGVGTSDGTASSPMDAAASVPEAPRFRCDGRTRCPQMHSCEEANWFVANCPNTEMDGDGDGVACERQWCSEG